MSQQQKAIIAAISENQVLGYQNKLMWTLPKDWENFKTVTQGKAFIMGRITAESEDMETLFSEKLNVIVSRQENLNFPTNFVLANSIQKAFDLLKDEKEIFILGGSQIFKQSIHLADYMYLTIVHDTFDGDAFFPKIDWNQWELVKSIKHTKDQTHSHAFSLNEYKRI